MHSVVSLCLCVLLLAIRCAEASSNKETVGKIRFEKRTNEEIANIKDENQKAIHDAGEKLVSTIRDILVMQSNIDNRISKKLSININETNKELVIGTNGSKYSSHKLADIVEGIKERSLLDTFGSLRESESFDSISTLFKNHVFISDPNSKSPQISLSKDELSNLVDSLKLGEVVTWYVYVLWADAPSEDANNERKQILEVIAKNDSEWRKEWDNLFEKIRNPQGATTSNGYDGAVFLSNTTFDEFQKLLENVCKSLDEICDKVNKDTVKAADGSEAAENTDNQLFRILKSMCAAESNSAKQPSNANPETKDKAANNTASPQDANAKLESTTNPTYAQKTGANPEAKDKTANNTASPQGANAKPSTKSENVANPASKQKTDKKPAEEKTWFEGNKKWITWVLVGVGAILIVVLLAIVFLLYKKWED